MTAITGRPSSVAMSQAPAATPGEFCQRIWNKIRQGIWNKICEVVFCIWEAIKSWFCCCRTEEVSISPSPPSASASTSSVAASILSVSAPTSSVAASTPFVSSAEAPTRSGSPALDYSCTATIEAALQQIKELFRSSCYNHQELLNGNAIETLQKLIAVYWEVRRSAGSPCVDVGLVFSERRIEIVALGERGAFSGSQRQVALDGTIYYTWEVEPYLPFDELTHAPIQAVTASEAPSPRGPSLDYSCTAAMEAAIQQIRELFRSRGYDQVNGNAIETLKELIEVYWEVRCRVMSSRPDVGLVFGQGSIDLVVLGERGSFSGSQFQRAPDGTAYYARRVRPYGPRE